MDPFSNESYREQRQRMEAEQRERDRKRNQFVLWGSVAGVVVLILGIVLAMSAERVDAGEACVVRAHGRVIGVAEPGWEWMVPGRDSLTCYSTRVQNLEFTGQESDANYTDTVVTHRSADGISVNLAAMLYFRLPSDNLPDIYDTYGRSATELVENHVQALVRDHVRDVVESHNMDTMYPDGINQISREIEENLGDALADRGVEIDAFEITAMDPDDAYTASIQDQAQEVQNAQLQRQQQEVAEEVAAKNLIEAQGEAEAQRARAEGEADANAIITESLTDDILLLEYYNTLETINWAILSPSDVQPMLEMATPTAEE